MHPLVPTDADIVTNPQPMCTLDGLQVTLTRTEAERLVVLAPKLRGHLPLEEAVHNADDAALIHRLHEGGIIFDLPISEDAVGASKFCDYLYARISGWRTRKPPDEWPWRQVIANGQATVGHLQGILLENYHYVRAAAVRQSPLLSLAATPAVFDLVRDFVIDEATHEKYFLATLTRWGLPEHEVQQAVPLTATAQFIALQYRLAHQSILDYLAGSATLEVDPGIYAREGDPYAPWETIYSIDPAILAPVRQHIHDDVTSGHSQLFRTLALASAPSALPIDVANSALRSARTVFEATRLWQREMYEHYHLRSGVPGTAGL